MNLHLLESLILGLNANLGTVAFLALWYGFYFVFKSPRVLTVGWGPRVETAGMGWFATLLAFALPVGSFVFSSKLPVIDDPLFGHPWDFCVSVVTIFILLGIFFYLGMIALMLVRQD